MQVHELASFSELEQAREVWDAAQAADPCATVFTSWSWMRSWLEISPFHWLVLAARANRHSPFVAFLPLTFDHCPNRLQFTRSCTMWLGGYPVGDYCGMVCRPEHESAVSQSFAKHLCNHLDWDQFNARDIADPRLCSLVVNGLKGCNVVEGHPTPTPQLEMPGDWEQFLTSLGRETRKTLRRRMREVEQQPGFSISAPDGDTIDEHLEAALELWRDRWHDDPVRDLCQEDPSYVDIGSLGPLFRRCFDEGTLWMRIMWLGAKPLAAQVAFLDKPRQAVRGYLLAWDRQRPELSPGIVMIAHAIREAISDGWRVLDFLRGAEQYKYSLNAVNHYSRNFLITRKRLRSDFRRRAEWLRTHMALRSRLREALATCVGLAHT